MFDLSDRRTQLLILALMLLSWFLVAPVWPQSAAYGHEGKYLLPNRTLTPGKVNPEIRADIHNGHFLVNGVEVNICAKGFKTRPFRKTTEEMKKQVCDECGSPKDCPDPAKGEIDHLVPLEIGGEDDVSNLWWQPSPQYHVKDKLEDRLKPLVCKGKMTLSEAQNCVRDDWAACAAKVKKLEAK